METIIWCFILHIALWWQEGKLWNVPANTGKKKGYCKLGNWSCSSISMIYPQIWLGLSNFQIVVQSIMPIHVEFICI